MMRSFLWLAGGVLLGGAIHILVILGLPLLAEETVWDRIGAFEARARVEILPPARPGEPNPFGLDPALIHGLCRLDLEDGPALLSGLLPDGFWSLAVYDPTGAAIYSATNRDGIGRRIELGLLTSAQLRQLSRQEREIGDDVLLIEAPSPELFILIRLAPPQPAMRPRYETALAALSCGPI